MKNHKKILKLIAQLWEKHPKSNFPDLVFDYKMSAYSCDEDLIKDLEKALK